MDTNPDLRKPRRLKGTYSYRVRNYVAIGFLSVGAVGALIFHYSKAGNVFKKSILDGKLAPTQKEIDHKILMGFSPFPTKTAGQILQSFKDEENEVHFKQSDL